MPLTTTHAPEAIEAAVPSPGPAVPDAAGDGGQLVPPAPHRRARRRTPRALRRLVGPLVVLAAWQLACSVGLFNSVELASPLAIVEAAQQLWSQGVLQSNLLVSLERVAWGLALGVGAGVILAVLCGLLNVVEDVLDPVIQAARAVPILGLVPLAIIWFGVGQTPKVFLIALGCTFPVYLNTYAAIRGVDAKLVEAGEVFGLRRASLVRRVILPGAIPGFLVGLRFSLVGSWLIVVVAEEINAKSGIGYLINAAQTWNRTDIMILGLAVYAVLGILADALVRLLERRLLVWRLGFEGG